MTSEAEATRPELPDGQYAIVEVMGHRTYVGRVSEIEQFGTKMLSVEPLFKDQLLDAVYVGGASIYQFTRCSKEVAQAKQPVTDWNLPPPVRATLPPEMLPAPEPEDFVPGFIVDGQDESE